MGRLISIFSMALLVFLCVSAEANAQTDWPNYNRTLTSERFSGLKQINATTVGKLAELCRFDTGEQVSFQTGLVQTAGAIFFTTEHDTFSIDPETCKLNWRAHEDFESGSLHVNRGAAYLDGRVFRGLYDGRVVAYDAGTGRKVWETPLVDHAIGENIPAAPIAWNGMVFIGNAGGNSRGVRGRMYGLDAATGKVVWEFYLIPKPKDGHPGAESNPAAEATWGNVGALPPGGGATWTSYTLDPATGTLFVPTGAPSPAFAPSIRRGDNLYTDSVVMLDARTGAYRQHFQFVAHDFHDFDVSTPPTVFTARDGRRMLAEAPKDGYLYAYDLAAGRRLFKTSVTHTENQEAMITATSPVRACPGHHGGAEWNGTAYDPQTDLLYTGEVDWCAKVLSASDEIVAATPTGKTWTGSGFPNPGDNFGQDDPPATASGHLTATSASTGKVIWKFDAPTPLLSGVTPTAGGLVLFGDLNGRLYALDKRSGATLWSQVIGGAIGGGVITYDTGAGQRVAVATGMTSRMWPGQPAKAAVVVMGVK